MTTANLTERTVTVNGKPIFYAETGTGAAVVMLHGGGPGASGVSNYSHNIDALAQHYRVIVPDLPGYGRSAKGIDVKGMDQSDPFGYLADMIRGLLDALDIDTAHLIGNSYGGAAALRLALDTPDIATRASCSVSGIHRSGVAGNGFRRDHRTFTKARADCWWIGSLLTSAPLLKPPNRDRAATSWSRRICGIASQSVVDRTGGGVLGRPVRAAASDGHGAARDGTPR